VKKLGKGGFGSVFQCRNFLDGTDYAIKKIRLGYFPTNEVKKMQNGGSIQMYSDPKASVKLREARIMSLMKHRNIVRYHQAWLEFEEIPTAKELSEEDEEDNSGEITESHPLQELDATQDESSVANYSYKNTINSEYFDDMSGLKPERNSIWTNPPINTTDFASKYQLTLFIQMQLCPQYTMSEWLQKRAGVDPQENLEILHQLLLGVEHIHRKGFIHRDLKPANLFISFNNRGVKVKIGDFGLSKQMTEEQTTNDTQITRTERRRTITKSLDIENALAELSDSNSLVRASAKSSPDQHASHTAGVGTYLYTSPEVLKSSQYDQSADIFSVGIILLELYNKFQTDMERAVSIINLRDKCQVPSLMHQRYAAESALVLEMTHPLPHLRPSAKELLNHPLFSSMNVNKDDTIKQQDEIIKQLQRQLSMMQANNIHSEQH
jgi:translation initiation factor 2-alpha kinase 1